MTQFNYEVLDRLCESKIGTRDVPCPLCGPDRRDPANRKRRVLRVWHREPGFASYCCARCGEEGWARSNSIRNNSGTVREHHRDHHEDPDRERRVKVAAKTWATSGSLVGSLGSHYLQQHRGLNGGELGDLDHVLRWDESSGAIVALMTDPVTNIPTGIHRTFLNPEGSKRERKMLGRQGVIRLSPDHQVMTGLGIVEGVEDGLAVLLSGWRPIWVATSAGAIERFPVLQGVESLTIFADGDGPGLKAAEACAARWREGSREIAILPPPGAQS